MPMAWLPFHCHDGGRFEAAYALEASPGSAGGALMNAECLPVVPAWNDGGELASALNTSGLDRRLHVDGSVEAATSGTRSP